jgi:hypothetical protein
MKMLDLSEIAGCMRKSFAERLVRTNLPHSMAVINPWPFVILRLDGEYRGAEVVRRLNSDPALPCVLPEN